VRVRREVDHRVHLIEVADPLWVVRPEIRVPYLPVAPRLPVEQDEFVLPREVLTQPCADVAARAGDDNFSFAHGLYPFLPIPLSPWPSSRRRVAFLSLRRFLPPPFFIIENTTRWGKRNRTSDDPGGQLTISEGKEGKTRGGRSLNYAKVSVAIKDCPALAASSSWLKAKIMGKLIPWRPVQKWMGGSFLEPPIGVAVKWAFYDVRYPGIVIHPSVVWFFGLKFQRITIQ
jgi:hypothetical protein